MSNFNQLKTDTMAFIGGEGFDELENQLPGLITMAETQLNRDLTLRAQRKRVTGTLVADVCTIPVPSDYLLPLMFRVRAPAGGDWIPLNLRTQEYATSAWPDPDYRAPARLYVVEADIIETYPVSDLAYAYEFRYKGRIPFLSQANQENWWSRNAYDLLLSAVILQAAKFIQDDRQSNLVQIWGSTYKGAAEGLLEQDRMSSRDAFENPKAPRATPVAAPQQPQG